MIYYYGKNERSNSRVSSHRYFSAVNLLKARSCFKPVSCVSEPFHSSKPPPGTPVNCLALHTGSGQYRSWEVLQKLCQWKLSYWNPNWLFSPSANICYLMMRLYLESEGFNVEIWHEVLQFSCVDVLFFFSSFNFTFAPLSFSYHKTAICGTHFFFFCSTSSCVLSCCHVPPYSWHLKIISFFFNCVFYMQGFHFFSQFCSISAVFYLTGSNAFQKLVPLL